MDWIIKRMEINKPYSKSLKKIINNTNPEQKEIANYFQRSNSQNLHQPTLPSLTSHQPSDRNLGHLRRKAHSMKVATEPSKIEEEQLKPRRAKNAFAELAKNRQTSLKETVDDIMYTLIQNGEAKVTNIKGMREQFQKKRLKNLRIATESQAQPVKKSRTHEQLQAIILNKQIEREKRIRKKFVFENPHIQKRVVTRWQGQKESASSKNLLSYYPLVDLRQQNEELLLNMPLKTEQYLRRLRQVALHKAFQ